MTRKSGASLRAGTLGIIVLFAATFQGQAQTITGSMAGRVVDQQGATIADATVTITEPSKSVTVIRKTSAGGDFSAPGLLPGNYSKRRSARIQKADPHRNRSRRR